MKNKVNLWFWNLIYFFVSFKKPTFTSKNKELLDYIYAKPMLKCVAHSCMGVYRCDYIVANNMILPIPAA